MLTPARLRKIEADTGLIVISPKDADALSRIRFAAEEGHPVLYEDLGSEIPSQLYYLLSGQTFIRKKRTYVQMGDTDVPLHENFRIYLTTREESPDYPPDTAMWISLIDFLPTEEVSCRYRFLR